MILTWCVIGGLTILISITVLRFVPEVVLVDVRILVPLVGGLGALILTVASDGTTRAMDLLDKARPVYEPWELQILEGRVLPFRVVFKYLRVLSLVLPVVGALTLATASPLPERLWLPLTSLMVFMVLAGAWALSVRHNLDNLKLLVDKEKQVREVRKATLEKLAPAKKMA